jgi:hypothetical protein
MAQPQRQVWAQRSPLSAYAVAGCATCSLCLWRPWSLAAIATSGEDTVRRFYPLIYYRGSIQHEEAGSMIATLAKL